MRRIVQTIILLWSICFVLQPVYGERSDVTVQPQYVFDTANLLDEDSIDKLEAEALQYVQKYKMDIVLVTTANVGGRTAKEFAEDFYNEYGFGTTERMNGTLVLIDIDNREFYILTTGDMIYHLRSSRLNTILSKGSNYIQNGDYYFAFSYSIKTISKYSKIPNEYQVNEKKERIFTQTEKNVFSSAVGLFFGSIIGLSDGHISRKRAKKAKGRMIGIDGSEVVITDGERSDSLVDSKTERLFSPLNTQFRSARHRTTRERSSASNPQPSSQVKRRHGGGGKKF